MIEYVQCTVLNVLHIVIPINFLKALPEVGTVLILFYRSDSWGTEITPGCKLGFKSEMWYRNMHAIMLIRE